MAKLITTLFTIALLLSFQLSLAARPDPAFTNNALKTQQDKEAEAIAVEDGGEISCAGLEMEECLMRRTLAAHVDYIYTQKHKP
ncbi:PREDICTED: phytosulfokines 3-like isoform X2 [Prunus mume]|uniref:Phytosulfokine n=1 Tax=Prunus mume TaxID=102107 RepID=A0ABM0N6T8_PRUMU|nr:PREDICTED: phytosulfokines 3-like isoform X2 [Prunus mume]